MKTIYLFTILIILFTSCSNKEENSNTITNSNTEVSSDSSALDQIKKLYQWYRENQNIQNCLVNNSCNEVVDSTKFYSVNFEATEKYLAKLKSTNCFSENYFSYWRNYFKKCEDDFKSNPANEGPPDGFDYDFLTNSQDFEEELKFVEKAKISKVVNDGSTKIVTIEFATGAKLKFHLSSKDNLWLIDRIE